MQLVTETLVRAQLMGLVELVELVEATEPGVPVPRLELELVFVLMAVSAQYEEEAMMMPVAGIDVGCVSKT